MVVEILIPKNICLSCDQRRTWQMKEQTKNMRKIKCNEKTKQRIKNIIKEIDPRNYPVSIREEKWGTIGQMMFL